MEIPFSVVHSARKLQTFCLSEMLVNFVLHFRVPEKIGVDGSIGLVQPFLVGPRRNCIGYDQLLGCWGTAVAQLVEALRYKSEGRGFDSRWCHWNFSLT